MYGIYAPGAVTENPGYATGWSDAGVIVPWTSWIQNGDNKVIEENWEGMEKYLAAIQAANPDYVNKKSYGIAFAEELLDVRQLGRGDAQPLGLHVELAIEFEIAFVHEDWGAGDAM